MRQSFPKSSIILPQHCIEIHHLDSVDKDNKSTFDLFSLAPALSAAFVAGIGWLLVERFARARERRADIRSLMSAFKENVDAIIADGVVYYGLAGAAPQAKPLATLIKSRLQNLNDQILVLRNTGMQVDVDDQLKYFRQTVTGGAFETFNRPAEIAGAPIFVGITSAGQALSNAVQLELFRNLANPSKYKAKWLSRILGAVGLRL